MIKAGSDCCKLAIKTTEDEEGTASLAVAKKTSTEVATVLSELEGIFTLRGEQKTALKDFLGENMFSLYS